MIKLPLGSFNTAVVPGATDVSIAVPQNDPLSFPVASNPWSVVVFTAPAGSGGGPVTVTWADVEDKPAFGTAALANVEAFAAASHTQGFATITGVDQHKLLGRHETGSGVAQQIGLDGGLEWNGGNIRVHFGTSGTTACVGNDSRLSDARTPTSHTHPLTDLTQTSATTRQVIEWAGSVWAAATPPLYIVNTSARSAQIPDNTATGGNNRGANATDLQSSRSSASQVASGTTSTIGGGRNNTASGTETVVAGGASNTASGERSTVSGGQNNTASGSNAAVGGGQFNSVTAENGWIPGGSVGSTLGISGAHAWASAGRGGGFGDNQHFGGVLGITTTNATPTVITANRAAPSTTAGSVNVHVLPNNSMWLGFIKIGARSTAGNTVSWHYEVHAKRGANAASTSVVDANLVRSVDGGLTGVSVAIAPNPTRGSVEVTGTGLAATDIDWTVEFFGLMNYR